MSGTDRLGGIEPRSLHLGDPASAGLSAGAASALAAAFHPDPMLDHLVPDPERRRRMLLPYFGSVLRQAGRSGRIRVTASRATSGMPSVGGETTDQPAVSGAAIAMPPGTYPLPVLPQLAEWRTMVASGWRATLRNFRDLPPIDAARPREPYWYLMYLGVHPAAQGHGHGAVLLRAVLDEADADGLPAYLVTMKEANLAWYGRFGFAVRDELRLGRSGPPAWSMLRPVPA